MILTTINAHKIVLSLLQVLNSILGIRLRQSQLASQPQIVQTTISQTATQGCVHKYAVNNNGSMVNIA